MRIEAWRRNKETPTIGETAKEGTKHKNPMEWKDSKKATADKIDNTAWKHRSNYIHAKEGRHKRYRDKVKQYKQNRTFQNNKRKI